MNRLAYIALLFGVFAVAAILPSNHDNLHLGIAGVLVAGLVAYIVEVIIGEMGEYLERRTAEREEKVGI